MPQALYFLLLLACPLAMVLMMRAMHGGHGHHFGADDRHEPDEVSLDDLRAHRSELDRQIADRELAESPPADARR